MQPASANTQYGILGQVAPELELNSWIDGNGKPMEPVKLKDYRGKVVYLYFFQDW
jgi:peroxiredoxin